MVMLIGQIGREMVDREAFQEVDYRRFLPQLLQVGDAGRPGRASARAAAAGVLDGALGPPGTRRARAARGHAHGHRVGRGRAGGRRRAGAPRARAARAAALAARRRRGARSRSSAAAPGRRRPQPTSAPSPRRATCRSRPPSAARTSSTTGSTSTSATRASASTRSSRRATARPICCSSPARGSARARPRATALVDIPVPQLPLVHAYPDPEELGRTYFPTLPIVTGMPELAAGLRELSRSTARASPVDRERARRLRREPAAAACRRATAST